MKKIYYFFLTITHIYLYPVFISIVRDEKSFSEFCKYLKKLNCPFVGFSGFLWLFLNIPEYRTVVYLRHQRIKRLIGYIYKPQVALQIDTPSDKIGTGIMFWHGYSTIINAESVGENFTCWHQVTIGNKLEDGNYRPTIKNNVKICTGAIVIGRITIGNNVIIGAGSVVVNDVPDNAIVAGVPARIIKYQAE